MTPAGLLIRIMTLVALSLGVAGCAAVDMAMCRMAGGTDYDSTSGVCKDGATGKTIFSGGLAWTQALTSPTYPPPPDPKTVAQETCQALGGTAFACNAYVACVASANARSAAATHCDADLARTLRIGSYRVGQVSACRRQGFTAESCAASRCIDNGNRADTCTAELTLCVDAI
jgi:hypothetical protein